MSHRESPAGDASPGPTPRRAQDSPGRSCPLHYLYPPASLARAAQFSCETLYVVGGLYGNPFALDALDALLARERTEVNVVFNGDFHWFDHEPELFRTVSERVLAHHAIRGNVETELGARDDTAGCGCAYPEWVDDRVVARSNAIENILRQTARRFPRLATRIAALPMNLVAQVGGARVAIVHGDAVSLSGWGFSRRALGEADGVRRAAGWFATANADVFACTHTCEPVSMHIDKAINPMLAPPASRATGLVFNNGAAGMPNFRSTTCGLVTRIARSPAAHLPALYGTRIAGVHVDALALHYDHEQWWQLFEHLWPAGSPAHQSYATRIRDGGDLDLAEATIDTARWRACG